MTRALVLATCGSLGRVVTTAAGLASTALVTLMGGRDGLVVLIGMVVWLGLFLVAVVIAGALGVHHGILADPVMDKQHQEQGDRP